MKSKSWVLLSIVNHPTRHRSFLSIGFDLFSFGRLRIFDQLRGVPGSGQRLLVCFKVFGNR